MSYNTLIVDVDDGAGVGLIRLNRKEQRNALNSELMDELCRVLDEWESDKDVRCVILTGTEKVFAAGADIVEMRGKSFPEVYKDDFVTKNWERLTRFRKPVIAAVAGYALGGGCELAMMCDIILAADNAKFQQPEINLGVLPGAGGTQRLTRIIGKSKAMEMCLTGRMMDAKEAERCGLASRVVPVDALMDEARDMAKLIASKSSPVAMMTKECVNAAYETMLSQGVQFERRLFHSTFATSDRQEGMDAFIEKRPAHFRHE